MKNLYKLRAFPKTANGGNKAGVYLSADSLTDDMMQLIAKEVGFSETAFVLKSQEADFKIRFFTPVNEVDLCGHATIATFNLLRDLSIIKPGIYTQETKAGILKLEVNQKNVFMQQKQPIFSEIIEVNELDCCFSNLEVSDTLKPQVVSTGIREIFLPVSSMKVLNDLLPDFKAMILLAKKYNCIGIHAFVIGDDCDAYGRNFAPVVGIDEESATGTSNGALACYIHKYHQEKEQYLLRQGYSMKQPSEIEVTLKTNNHLITEVWVGGSATIIE